MSDPAFYTAGEASLWLQPYGANTEPLYLGCHELLDIEQGMGDLEARFCPDPAQVGKFVIKRKVRGAPDLPSFEISVPVGKTLDYIEKLRCPANLIINKVACGRRDLFTNYDRSFILRNAEPTAMNYAALASRDPDTQDDTMVTVPMVFDELHQAVKLDCSRQAIAATENLLAVAFLNDLNCGGLCGGAIRMPGQVGVVGGKGAVAATAVLYITRDGGATWTAAAADPFAVAEDIGAVGILQYDMNTVRILVARSVTAAAAPAEIAYSDDYGATWTNVDVGATNGQFITSLFVLDRNAMWAGTDDGFIYKSTDGGASWVVQEAGVLALTDYLAIHFADAQVGFAGSEANTLSYTTNGGVTWAALTLDASMAASDVAGVYAHDRYHIWVIYDSGEIWFTNDGGITWTKRYDVGAVGVDIVFANQMMGFAASDSGLFRTRDGGYTWEGVCSGFAKPLTDLCVVDENHAVLVGEVSGTTAQVIDVQ